MDWTDQEKQTLRVRWLAGDPLDAIMQDLPGRTSRSIRAQRCRLGLPARPSGSHSRRAAEFGFSALVTAAPINEASRAMNPEVDAQAALWGNIKFDDDNRATRAEAKLRGLPDAGRSQVGCAAAMVVGS